MELVAGMRKWMFDEEEEHKHVHDGFARTLCDAVKQVVEEVKGEQGLWPQAFMVAKLDFRHSDRLRASHLAMIKCRYFESLRDPTAGKKRTKPNIYLFAMALHLWLRQLSLNVGWRTGGLGSS